MLSLESRRQIFGIAFETVFEAGDALHILRDLENDDENMAITAFQFKWQKIIKILIDLSSWIMAEEAKELVGHLMNYYKIYNYRIWESVIDTDQTLLTWMENHKKDYDLQRADKYGHTDVLKGKEKTVYQRQNIIRAIISALMIDTPIIQDEVALKRNNKIFKDELLIAMKKIARIGIKTSADEIKEMLKKEFILLPEAELIYVDEVFPQIFPTPTKTKPASSSTAAKKTAIAKIPIPLPPPPPKPRVVIPILENKSGATDDEDLDQMFDNIQLPPMVTKEAVTIMNGDGPKNVMQDKKYEVNSLAICDHLYQLIEKLGEDEINDRAMEELRNYQKHSRDCEKIGDYWQILKGVERNLSIRSLELQKKNDPSTSKVRKLVGAVSMYKIKIGNDRDTLKKAERVFSAQ